LQSSLDSASIFSHHRCAVFCKDKDVVTHNSHTHPSASAPQHERTCGAARFLFQVCCNQDTVIHDPIHTRLPSLLEMQRFSQLSIVAMLPCCLGRYGGPRRLHLAIRGASYGNRHWAGKMSQRMHSALHLCRHHRYRSVVSERSVLYWRVRGGARPTRLLLYNSVPTTSTHGVHQVWNSTTAYCTRNIQAQSSPRGAREAY